MKQTFLAILSLILIYSCSSPIQQSQNQDEEINKFFDSIFDDHLSRDPEYQTVLGDKSQYHKWNDISDKKAIDENQRVQNALKVFLNRFKRENLIGQSLVSYDLFVQESEDHLEAFPYRFHKYFLNQMEGKHSSVPSFLINMHTIENKKEAVDYLSRLNGIPDHFRQLVELMKVSESKGIIPPKFVFPSVLDDSKNLMLGYPFEKSKTLSPLWEDFSTKINKLQLSNVEKKELLNFAEKALIDSVKPAYDNLMLYWTELEKKASEDDGCWKFPDGGKFYAISLKQTTTTSLSPEEIHRLGIDEVKRIHAEMEVIKEKVGFKGTLLEFFNFMRTDKKFYFSNDEKGKKAYVDEANKIIEGMRVKLDDLFLTKPKANLVVKPVEAYREKSAGGAFYEEPALDGSRPGRYYINLYTLSDQPIYQMEALAYHEAIPGHHMQIAIAQELKNLPKFRKLGGNTAYVEGWALYSELIPKEIGFYQDAYSDFGRLAIEVFRASRLVIDTGIHYKKWTRKQALQYMIENTPNPEGDCAKEIDRYIVWPSQATGYKVGMVTILKLREKCKKQLGDKFNIKEFHDVVLTNGPVPLNILENLVNEYIGSKLKS
jgi:uncharacterized protein (DUF885 family)